MLLSSDIDWTMLTSTSGTHLSIDITPLTQLRSIEFIVDVVDDQNPWVTQTLSRISSTHIKDVTFKLVFFDGKDIADTLEWSNVDAILQHSTFSRLRKVHFRWLPSLAGVMQRLPHCAARGILRV
jgi:hypothetical protein